MYFHFHCDDQGYDLLADLFRKTALEEMLHIERISERLLFLGGDVEMVVEREPEKIHDIRKMLEKGREMEESTVKLYNQFANECATNADSASKRLFEDLVLDEERHYDQYDTEIDQMDRFGDKYLALQSIERSKNRASGQAPA
jgi:bacterioferritin